MVSIHIQEEGANTLDRPLGVTGRIRQAGLRSGCDFSSTGLGFGESYAFIFTESNWSSANPIGAAPITSVDICVSHHGSSEGRLTISYQASKTGEGEEPLPALHGMLGDLLARSIDALCVQEHVLRSD